MECSKLAEATLEASISALLSAYALAHHDIPQTIVYLGITQEMMVFCINDMVLRNHGLHLDGL